MRAGASVWFPSPAGRGLVADHGESCEQETLSVEAHDLCARDLRQTGTPPEQLLWLALRNEQIGGLKFRRQYPIGPYVVDFYCHSAKVAVEVDGMSHEDKLARYRANEVP